MVEGPIRPGGPGPYCAFPWFDSPVSSFGVDLTACWRLRVGMVTASVELARALVGRDGHRWVVFASRQRPEGLGGAEAVLSPHRHEIANKVMWLPRVEAAAGLDAVLYPYWPSPPLRSRTAPPAVVFVHDLAFRVRPDEVPWQQRLYLGTLVPRALRHAAAVITPSSSARADLLAAFPLPGLADRVRVVPEGPTGLPPGGALPDGIEPGFLLAVGTIEPRKNYPRLVAAYRILKSRLAAAPPLVVVGRTGWAYGNALDLLRAEPGVHLLGHVGDAALGALYREAAALAFPSLYEGFGLPLLDAMAAGLPALIGADGALPELGGGAALAVDAHDAEAIAAGLERILTDSALRAELAAAGRRRAAEYGWDAAGGSVLEVLEGAADRMT